MTDVDRVEQPGREPPSVRRVVTMAALVAAVGGAVLAHRLTDHTHEDAVPAAVSAVNVPLPGIGVPPERTSRQPRAWSPAGQTASGLSASGRITGRVTSGGRLTFEVTLRPERFFSLRPCPHYVVRIGSHRSDGRLDCDHAPYTASIVRPDGRVTDFRPVLPAGTETTFRIRVRVPQVHGTQPVQWQLRVPGHRPVVVGEVEVDPGR